MWTWFKIFSLTEFLAEEIVSRSMTVSLEGVGEKEILITQGNCIGITCDETYLSPDINGNAYTRDGLGIFKDSENYIWLGIQGES